MHVVTMLQDPGERQLRRGAAGIVSDLAILGQPRLVRREVRLLESRHPATNIFLGKICRIQVYRGQKAPRQRRERNEGNIEFPARIENADFDGFLSEFRQAYSWLPSDLAHRYARAYGTLAKELVGDAGSLADLGENFGDGLYESEVDYLMRREWARTAEDILWRRSKLGLHVSEHTVGRLEAWLSGDRGGERGASAARASTL